MKTGWLYRFATGAANTAAGGIAFAGTSGVVAAGFALSFDAVKTVAIAAHIRPSIAWLMPVTIDGSMAVATVTALVMKHLGRKPGYPWIVVGGGALISIACNGLHAYMGGGAKPINQYVAVAVSAIPALLLAATVHLLVLLVEAVAALRAPAAAEGYPLPVSAPPRVDDGGVPDWLDDPWKAFGTPVDDAPVSPAVQMPVPTPAVQAPQPVSVQPEPPAPAVDTAPARTGTDTPPVDDPAPRADTPAARIEMPPSPLKQRATATDTAPARTESDDELLPAVRPVVEELAEKLGRAPGGQKLREAFAELEPPVKVSPNRALRLRDLVLSGTDLKES